MAKKSKKEIFDIIEEIIIDKFQNAPMGTPYNTSNITMESRLGEDGIGADSLDVVEITMVFEDEFGIELIDEDVQKVIEGGNIISDYVDLIEKHID